MSEFFDIPDAEEQQLAVEETSQVEETSEEAAPQEFSMPEPETADALRLLICHSFLYP